MSHVVDCVYRPVYLALYAGVATGSAALVLEDGAGFVLVALEAFVQLSVYYVRTVQDKGDHADKATFFFGVEGVPEPDFRACVCEA